MRQGLAAIVAAGLMSTASAGEPVEVTSYPIKSFAIARDETRFGDLEFLGGAELVSRDRRFGGISGIDLLPDGRSAVMISDNGYLIRGTLTYDDSRLTGLSGAKISPLSSGAAWSKESADVEDLVLDPGDPRRGYLVMERRSPALVSFALGEDGLSEISEITIDGAPDELLESNRGLESVAVFPPASPTYAGKVLAIAEHAAGNDRGAIPGWIVGIGELQVSRRDEFDVSSARFLPNGDLILLERRFAPAWGIGARLRRVPAAKIRPGVLIEGETILDAGITYQIDNLEALAVSRDETGRTILTLVSDDNTNVLQRTLILQFALVDD